MAYKSKMIEVAQEYFRLADAGDPAIVNLFTDDVQIYFPKFGIGWGPEAFLEVSRGVAKVMASGKHPSETYNFIEAGHYLVVEGTTSGTLRDGTSWSAGETPAGRFCNVFEFRGSLIARLHVYLDPDYGSSDSANFHWGRENRSW